MFILFIFIFGLTIGSFLNVLINRLPNDEGIGGRSYCPKCKTQLKWYDLVPVLSFIILRARCRYCHDKISWQYPIIEITTGLLFLLVFTTFYFQLSTHSTSSGQAFNLFFYLFITACLIVIFTADLKYYIIPDQIIYLAIACTFFYRFLEFLEFDIKNLFGAHNLELGILLNPLLSAFIFGGFFLFLILASKGKWMGVGDLKLAFFMGLLLGWPNILIAFYLSFLSGALIGIILILFQKKGWKSEIPFGTFLSASAFITLLWGDFFLDKIFF